MKNMKFYYCLIISILGIAHGSPYYYREDKHHSEHHKEYSYSNSQPSFSAYESSPQKYIESSHFSTHVAPQRYYKLETSPSLSSSFSQYSGGGQSAFHQREFQGKGIQSGFLSPQLAGQSINVEGVKPGTYVIKQVNVYRQPATYTGFYGTSHFDGSGLETGQQQENLYGSIDKENLKAQAEQYVKQVQKSLYHQVPQALPTIIQDESLFGQKQISKEDFSQFSQEQINGQKEDSLYNEHMEDLGQQPQRGDLDIGQEQQDLRTHHSQIVKTVEKKPFDDKNKGYKYYEKKVITYGSPDPSNTYKNTYVHHTQIHRTTDIGGKGFGKHHDILSEPATIKTTNGFENIHTGSKQESKHVIYSHEAVNSERKVKPQTYYNNPVFTPQPIHLGQQIHRGSLEKGQHEESQYGQHSLDLGQQLVSGSLELGQQPDSLKHLETSPFEIGQTEESLNGKRFLNWERHVNTSTVEEKESRIGTAQKPIEHHFRTERLEIGHSTNNKPHVIVKENVTRTVIVGHNIPTKPVRKHPEGQVEEAVSGQNIKTALEIGQREENIGQLETGNLGIGQYEENMGQLETGVIGIGQHEENTGQLETGVLGIGQHEENMGQLETGVLGIGQHEENMGQLETGVSGIGQREENMGQLETGVLGIGQHEENMGQLETGVLGIGQREENMGQLETGVLGIGQREERLEIRKKSARSGPHIKNIKPDNDKFNSGQKEETSFEFQQSKNIFPSKLIATPTKASKYNEHTSYVKTYNQHESHYKEHKQTANSKLKDLPVYYQKYDSTATPRSNDQENINKNTDYLKLQQKAEELARQLVELGLEDISKQKSSQQESNEDKFEKKNIGRTLTSEVHSTETQEHLIANHHASSMTPNKKIATWKVHKEYNLNYPLTSQELYSKKQTKHHYESQSYTDKPMSQNYGYQKHQHSSHFGGYGQSYSMNSKEGAYLSDQPIQRTHTTGSQFSFSGSSGNSQDRQKVIDDFLKELDKDIAITNHQQRQQQGSYTGVTNSRPVNSGVTYYSQRTVSTHSNSSYSSRGTVPEGTTGKAWYQKIGDSIGSSYNQAKEKAKEIVKSVKQSVGYSSS